MRIEDTSETSMIIHNPEDFGVDSYRLERLNELMASYVDEGKLAGTLTVLSRRGSIVHAKATGMANVEASVPMEMENIFRIYSMTKPITTVAAMILLERGLFHLNTPVSEFFPAFKRMGVFSAGTVDDYTTVKAEREMTVADLMKHTSGLTYAFLASNVVDDLYKKNNIDFVGNSMGDKEAVLKTVAEQPLVFSPGSAWNYSISTDVLGCVIEQITGQSLGEFLRKEIFEPLHMEDTDFHVPESKISRVASMYGSHLAGNMIPGFKGMPAGKKMKRLNDPDNPTESRMPTLQSGGGGLYSTAMDYMKFLHMLLNKGRAGRHCILSPKTIDYMTCNHLPTTMAEFLPKNLDITPRVQEGIAKPGYGFGLGFAVRVDNIQAQNIGSLGEYYWGGAASTAFFVDPHEQLSFVLMTQLLPSSTYPIRNEITRAIYQSLVE